MDLEAGIEHLGRASAQGVDALLVVVDPDRRSLDTAKRILALAQEIGIPRVYAVGNKARSEEDLVFVKEGLPCELLGMIPFSPQIQAGARFGRLPEVFVSEAAELFSSLEARVLPSDPDFPFKSKLRRYCRTEGGEMSRIIAQAAIRGAHQYVERAERELK